MSAGMIDRSVARAARLIVQADALIIAAGAGMGVDSGLPDFRGNSGFWKAYPALAGAGLDFVDVASPRTFARDPALAWGFYGHRLALYRRTVPHGGFEILRRWARAKAHGAFVYTSNVDGQFQRAGFPEDDVCECHGSIHWVQCARPCREAPWPADELRPDVDPSHCRWRGDLPACPDCARVARPNILMFGDGAWVAQRSDRQQARLRNWLAEVGRPVVIELGAGTQVATVRAFSERLVERFGARLVRINPRECEVAGRLDVELPLGALAALAAIETAIASL